MNKYYHISPLIILHCCVLALVISYMSILVCVIYPIRYVDRAIARKED